MPSGPHACLPACNPAERLLAAILDRLWETYRERVPYVQVYERLITQAGATFVNDHIAFRTLAGQTPVTGIVSVSRVFEALGYIPAGTYQFPDKYLTALHYQHPNQLFPKLFISELQLWKLGPVGRSILQSYLSAHAPSLTTDELQELACAREADHLRLIERVLNYLQTRPWPAPLREDVLAVNAESQYAAWVLVHGYNVNHFTALINSHGADELADLEKTVSALQAAGVPLKDQIEGAPGSRLRQTATEAAVVEVEIRDAHRLTTMPWSYAYFELAERGTVTNPETGQTQRFEGFLGPQATQLFEMTRVR